MCESSLRKFPTFGADVSDKGTIMTTWQVAIIFCGVQASSRGFLRIVNRSVLSAARYVSFAEQKTASIFLHCAIFSVCGEFSAFSCAIISFE